MCVCVCVCVCVYVHTHAQVRVRERGGLGKTKQASNFPCNACALTTTDVPIDCNEQMYMQIRTEQLQNTRLASSCPCFHARVLVHVSMLALRFCPAPILLHAVLSVFPYFLLVSRQ